MSECPYCEQDLPIVHPPSRLGAWHSLDGWLEPCEGDGPSDEDFGLPPRSLAELESLMASQREAWARGGWTPEMVTATCVAYRVLRAELEAVEYPDPFGVEGWGTLEATAGTMDGPAGSEIVRERRDRAAHNRAYLEACRRREEELAGRAA